MKALSLTAREALLAQIRDAVDRRVPLAQVAALLASTVPARNEDAAAFIDSLIPLCQQLSMAGRAFDAVPIAQTCVALADQQADGLVSRKAATAAGILLKETGDYAGALAHHGATIRTSIDLQDPTYTARGWNNVGAVCLVAGVYDLAVESFARAMEIAPDPQSFTAYCSQINLAQCYLHLGQVEDGLAAGSAALSIECIDHIRKDPFVATLLRLNYVRLLTKAGDFATAERLTTESEALAIQTRSPRVALKSKVTRASLEIAQGRLDIGMTRLEGELIKARHIPADLVDTLVSVVHAEEVAGRPGRAVVYLMELADHIYRQAITEARKHIEIAACFSDQAVVAQDIIEWKIAALREPHRPVLEWDFLERLAQRSAMVSGHDADRGHRIGVVSRLIAIDAGCAPTFGTEIEFAASLHDVGLIAIPAGIVRKREDLNGAQMSILMDYPARGREILDSSAHPRALLAGEIALYHREHWNGSGFPEKLRGETIPKAARICSVAIKAVDAMSRGGMEAAVAAVAAAAGTELDPALCNLFTKSAHDGLVAKYAAELAPSANHGVTDLIKTLARR